MARAHQPAERVDLPDQVPFRGPADGRIARHVRNRAVRERADPDVASEPRRRPCGLDAGMTGANHDHIEIADYFALTSYFTFQCKTG